MSTIKVDTLVAADGSSAVTLTKQTAAKTYANWTGSSTIADSYNLASITDNGTGYYSLNYTNNFSTANYACSGLSQIDQNTSYRTSYGADGIVSLKRGYTDPQNTNFSRIGTGSNNGTLVDNTETGVVIHGDLA